MSELAFRFGMVAATARTGAAWADTARRAEDLGFDTLLVPDTLQTLSPFPAAAAAAASTSNLRVGTYVLSATNRSPGLVAWEAQSLQLLSDGRFELGVGGGRPGADRDAAALGGDFGSPADRLRRVAATNRAVRATPAPPRLLVAPSKPKMFALAAEQADTVALGLPPQATEDDLAATVRSLRTAAGSRRDELEVHLNLVAVAERAADIPEWVSRMTGGGDARQMAADGGIAFLLGSSGDIADQLRRRREAYGISYIAVNALFAEQFAPVVAMLRGR
jgi:probable F420-dependent oxidoreductase